MQLPHARIAMRCLTEKWLHTGIMLQRRSGRARMTDDDYRPVRQRGLLAVPRFRLAAQVGSKKRQIWNQTEYRLLTPVTEFYPPTPNSNRNPVPPLYYKLLARLLCTRCVPHH